jgi:hypothetical protein
MVMPSSALESLYFFAGGAGAVVFEQGCDSAEVEVCDGCVEGECQ